MEGHLQQANNLSLSGLWVMVPQCSSWYCVRGISALEGPDWVTTAATASREGSVHVAYDGQIMGDKQNV